MKPSKIVLALIITSAILLILYKPTHRTSIRTDDTVLYHNLSLNHKSAKIMKAGDKKVVFTVDVSGGSLPDGFCLAIYHRPKSIPGFVGEISFTRILMIQSPDDSHKYIALLDSPGKGSALEYYIQLEDDSGAKAAALRPASSYYSLRFEGKSSVISIGAHILAMFLQLLFLVLILLTSLENLYDNDSNKRIGKQCLWLTIFLFVGFFPIGILLEYQTNGYFWSGIPVGMDITQSAALIIFLYWFVLTILMKGSAFASEPSKNILKPIGIRICTILGFVLTMGLFMIPHR